MKALDLFCGGGGAARGILAAGFDEIVGIDNADHSKSYPGHFILGDALRPPVRLSDFDFVWASPPCQRFSAGNLPNKAKGIDIESVTVDLTGKTRQLLSSHRWTVIENVPAAPIRPDICLTGPAMGLSRLLRKRIFETSWFSLYPPPIGTKARIQDGTLVCVTKGGSMSAENRKRRRRKGLSASFGRIEMADAMGLPHGMTKFEIGEAVPPAYAEFIAREALRQIRHDLS